MGSFPERGCTGVTIRFGVSAGMVVGTFGWGRFGVDVGGSGSVWWLVLACVGSVCRALWGRVRVAAG